jgi:hypothetical protein
MPLMQNGFPPLIRFHVSISHGIFSQLHARPCTRCRSNTRPRAAGLFGSIRFREAFLEDGSERPKSAPMPR